jgi:uncharacterized protein (DUF2267 family)
MNRDHAEPAPDDRVRRLDAEMAEVALLLPARWTAALERLASARGMTLGRLIRLLIHDYLACHAGSGAARAEAVPVATSRGEKRAFPERRRAMSQTDLTQFDSTLQTTHVWLNDIQERLGWEEPYRAYHALRAVLHALRDRLPVEQVAALAAQLPMLVRGFYYEGWHPHGKPVKERHKEEFLAHIAAAFRDDPDVDPEQVTRAVFRVLAKHVSAGEVESVKNCLPGELRSLWP